MVVLSKRGDIAEGWQTASAPPILGTVYLSLLFISYNLENLLLSVSKPLSHHRCRVGPSGDILIMDESNPSNKPVLDQPAEVPIHR